MSVQNISHGPVCFARFARYITRKAGRRLSCQTLDRRQLMVDYPTLETSRLTLREILESDAESLLQIHGDHEHMRWFGSDPIPNLDDARKLVATFASWRKEPVSGARWAMELKDRPGLIGTCGLFRWNRNWRSCVVGYEIAPAHQGRGYVREALEAVITWGFREVQLNRIEAQVHPDNKASLALLATLGFLQEGHQRDAGYWAGRHHDLLQYALLKAQWSTTSVV
ncbi:GNAT family N-acetyltransferase [Variovorax sp. 54]|uniref:GNAT family N-acetyltransferase n=1 Tax=Variovorax sp. 54 TaxID=2035212 RepID=UPI0027BB0E72|nr:GNAT family protein [Variovorax sp. 54]